jgi:alpha-glucosidase (family GH31 glycosyl hydrolase)
MPNKAKSKPKSYRRDIRIAENEYWWGGAVQDGSIMPLHAASAYQLDLRRTNGGNQAQPLLVSSEGRYLWSEEPFLINVQKGSINIEGEAKIEVSGGHGNLRSAYVAAMNKHFPPRGKTPDPLNFTAPQYNTWIEMMYEATQEKVLDYVQRLRKHGFPPGIFMIDDNWMEDYGQWTFHPQRFPDPRKMTAELRKLGFKLVLWVCPLVSPDHLTARMLRKKEWLIREPSGEIAVRRWWNGYSAVLDLTNPEARGWFHQQLDHLVKDCGVHGFKLDAGDLELYRPTDVTFAPTSPARHCEEWARMGLRYRSSEYRACWKNGNQPLIQRLRDKHPTWGRDGLSDLIPNGIAQGLMGFAFNCPDLIGGGDYIRFLDPKFRIDQELFVRTTQCSTLFPIMQFSVAPWRVLDKEYLGYVMEMVRLREKLGSEIAALARSSARSGEPIMRSMAYACPNSGYERVSDQFLLGDRILVAPVLAQGARKRTIVFPGGTWRGDDGSEVRGPVTREVLAPLSRLPWYRKD